MDRELGLELLCERQYLPSRLGGQRTAMSNALEPPPETNVPIQPAPQRVRSNLSRSVHSSFASPSMTFHNSRNSLQKVIGGVLHRAKDYSSRVFQIPFLVPLTT